MKEVTTAIMVCAGSVAIIIFFTELYQASEGEVINVNIPVALIIIFLFAGATKLIYKGPN